MSAWGKNSNEIIKDLNYLINNDGYALMIGVDIRRLTAMHYVEGCIPEKVWPLLFSPLNPDIEKTYRSDEYFLTTEELPKYLKGWLRVQSLAEKKNLIRHGKIGHARCMFFKIKDVTGIYENEIKNNIQELFDVDYTLSSAEDSTSHSVLTELQLHTIESYNQSAEMFNSTIALLSNYDITYDYLVNLLEDGGEILDLACGSGKISSYISGKKKVSVTGVDLSEKMLNLAQTAVPKGQFYKRSIIDFTNGKKYYAVIIGFGIPYLNEEQTDACISNAIQNTKEGGYVYVSFMEGSGSRLEKTSFGGGCDFLLHYYTKEYIIQLLEKSGMKILKEFELAYKENDGSITNDIVLIGKKGT